MARVLPWPKDNSTHKTPRDHLDALGIKSLQGGAAEVHARVRLQDRRLEAEEQSQDGLSLMASTHRSRQRVSRPRRPPRSNRSAATCEAAPQLLGLLGWAPAARRRRHRPRPARPVRPWRHGSTTLTELRSHEETSDADLAAGVAAVVGAVAGRARRHRADRRLVPGHAGVPRGDAASATSSSPASPTC